MVSVKEKRALWTHDPKQKVSLLSSSCVFRGPWVWWMLRAPSEMSEFCGWNSCPESLCHTRLLLMGKPSMSLPGTLVCVRSQDWATNRYQEFNFWETLRSDTAHSFTWHSPSTQMTTLIQTIKPSPKEKDAVLTAGPGNAMYRYLLLWIRYMSFDEYMGL